MAHPTRSKSRRPNAAKSTRDGLPSHELVESSGGIERGALRHLNLIAKRITGNKGSDRTKYGTHPLAPKSFVPHHMQRLSVAAVKGDAKGVRAAANSLKRKVMGNAASAAAVGARA